jgi:hypothetical protein
MATLLSKLLPNEIAEYIYYISLNEYLQQKIDIYSINMFLIFEKHINYIKLDSNIYNIISLLYSDINRIISVLNFTKVNFIDPYKKWNIKFEKKYIDEVNEWRSAILKFIQKYIDELNSTMSIQYFYKLLLKQKILIKNIDEILFY